MKTEKQQSAAASAFAERWKGKGYEKGDSQLFWTELLTEIFGVENPNTFIRYEEQVKVDNTNFIDGHIRNERLCRNTVWADVSVISRVGSSRCLLEG